MNQQDIEWSPGQVFTAQPFGVMTVAPPHGVVGGVGGRPALAVDGRVVEGRRLDVRRLAAVPDEGPDGLHGEVDDGGVARLHGPRPGVPLGRAVGV